MSLVVLCMDDSSTYEYLRLNVIKERCQVHPLISKRKNVTWPHSD